MKMFFSFLFLLISLSVNSQDEFAATSFYQDLKKLIADGQAGFSTFKGKELKSQYPEFQAEYEITLPLVPADSGKLIFPLGKAPYAVYYFEPSKNRIKTDQKALSLRDALQTAFEKPLYVRTSTYVLDKKPFTNSYFFDNANEVNNANAIFRTCLYFQNDKYYLLLEVRGKK